MFLTLCLPSIGRLSPPVAGCRSCVPGSAVSRRACCCPMLFWPRLSLGKPSKKNYPIKKNNKGDQKIIINQSKKNCYKLKS